VEKNRLTLLRLITQRHRELQGLRALVIMAACLMAYWSQPYMKLLRYSGSVGVMLGLIGTVLPWIIVASLTPLLNRYYQRRFGRVLTTAQQRWGQAGAVVLLVGAAWFDLATVGRAGPSAVLIAGAAIALHVVVRDWPWRAYHLVAALACGLGAWLTATLPAMRIESDQDVLRISLSILLLSNFVPAWLDHRLLATALPFNPAAGADEDEVLAPEEGTNHARPV
jgi:hypothetical protein